MIEFKNKKVLILSPHADDETIGCGGIIQKYKAAGSEVHVLVFSFVRGTFRKFDKRTNEYVTYDADQRLREFVDVMDFLGVTSYTILRDEDRSNIQYHHKLDRFSVSEFLPDLENYVKNIMEPDVMLIPARSKNQDHRFVNDVAITLARPYFLNASILEYEVDGEIDFHPNLFVSLTEMESQNKCAAIAGHTTQQSGDLHPTSVENQRSKMRFRGASCYSQFAEAFRVVRLIQ